MDKGNLDVITIRLPPTLVERVDEQAEKSGMSRASCIRRLLAEQLDNAPLEKRIAELFEFGIDRLNARMSTLEHESKQTQAVLKNLTAALTRSSQKTPAQSKRMTQTRPAKQSPRNTKASVQKQRKHIASGKGPAKKKAWWQKL